MYFRLVWAGVVKEKLEGYRQKYPHKAEPKILL